MPFDAFPINTRREMEFIYNSILMGNGTHAVLDMRARKCVNAEVHGLGMSLQFRAEKALGFTNKNIPTDDFKGMIP